MENAIKLQGVYGRVQAKPAGDLKPGDVTMWNFGYTETVVSVTPSKTGKTVTAEIVSDASGKHFIRKMSATRLVAIADRARKGA